MVRATGVELWELEFSSRAGGGLLRIYIDRPEGITVDDCARVSHAVSAVLETDDPVPGQYTLEVSSPGLDRVLRTREHFARFVNAVVRVETKTPIEGRKRYTGRVSKVSDADIELRVGEGADDRVVIPLSAVHRARVISE